MEEVEYCDPFDGRKFDYYMKLEHAGRYIFAENFITKNKLKNIADITCASGYGTELLSKSCEHIDGYDVNTNYLLKAKKRKIPNADFYQVNLNDSLNIQKQYDLVVCFETLEHIENTKIFSQTLSKIIAPNGYLIISVPNPKFEELDENGKIIYKFHKHIFKKQHVIDLFCKLNFKLLDITGQSLCNTIVTNQHKLKHGVNKKIYNKKLLNKYNYKQEAIIMNSYIYAYPNDVLIDQSYSYIYLFKKMPKHAHK